jgi:hypothetical protein
VAERLAMHAKSEEEPFYPAAVVVGDVNSDGPLPW